MVKRLLIDGTHEEEVRIAVVNGSNLEEFDSESASKRLIKSNIYLAKVIRVEPSLQAAFVEYNNGRHGFLPFSEIHPDYYRIPVGDRNLSEEMLEQSSIDEEQEDISLETAALEETANSELVLSDEGIQENIAQDKVDEDFEPIEPLETIGGDDIVDLEENYNESIAEKKRIRYRYKIQEVIKRRQILLVQVVKEERGNKGAALTSYLSLPGRYCVLMPNAGHRAGGVSRKISDGDDRRRLRELMKELEVPDGMSLIVRTAGQERNRLEIKRDYEYLLRIWDEIREKTLNSIAPALVYAEGDLVKRAIRDIYDRDIEEVLIEGDEAYKSAKNFMKSLIPSHVKKVKLYNDRLQPIFHRFNVEEQIEKMHEPLQTLPSGGSIVINHTEALVAIDVNSGRSTRERNIDDTAFKTNLEAATEIARQLRLRDIGGLVVVDFIDMQDQGNISQVERKMRDLLKNDRARIQIGRISQFGLLEMSRQRLRPSLLESHSTICGHCQGKGTIRSIESLALQILRDIERMSITGTVKTLLAIVPSGVDLFLLNQKRDSLVEIEKRFEVSIQIDRSENLTTSEFNLEVLEEKQRSLKIVSSKNDKIEKNSKQIQEPVYKEDRAENNPEINAAEVEIDQSIVNSVSDESDFSRENNINRNKNRRRHKIRRSDVNKNVVDENTVQNENKENSEFNSVKDDENNQTIAENKTENSKDAARSDFRNQNRRRRHPYQRRHQNNRFENNGTNISSDENKSQIVDKAAVVNIRSGSNQRTQSSKKLESKEAKSSDGGEEQSDKSSKKGWLRRLLE